MRRKSRLNRQDLTGCICWENSQTNSHQRRHRFKLYHCPTYEARITRRQCATNRSRRNGGATPGALDSWKSGGEEIHQLRASLILTGSICSRCPGALSLLHKGDAEAPIEVAVATSPGRLPRWEEEHAAQPR